MTKHINVARVATNGLSRRVWEFSTGNMDGPALRLTRHHVQSRAQPKGAWRGPALSDRWRASDERSYVSGLPRPTGIPADVVAEAQAAVMPPRVFIGWFAAEHEWRP